MESNKQTELTSKIKTDSQIESRRTPSGWGRVGDGGIEQKGKRTTVGDCWRERGIRGLNVNGKNTIKIKIFLKDNFTSSFLV